MSHKTANVISEAIATVVLIFAIGSMVNSALITDQALPYLIGVLVWAIGLSLGGPTGNAMNPARDLAPRIAHWVLPIVGKGSSGWRYAWVPIAGPLLGAVLAAALRRVFF
ncbi:aquaporin [Cobetia sp. LC6]|uniref:aquaporin n=1 Tax=Cobetia sp. LC6 TaxID=3050947 RepID=UPI0025536E3F|nr:aquaporin [Cobetia sp. LC6]MDL2192010.1 aquaporin [Cobetia sp. LC6]